MSEEIPPSSLVTRPDPAGDSTADARYTLRLTTRRWAAIPIAAPTKAAATVIGAWLVLAWNRFGFQGLAQLRVMLRFVLIGVYGWLGLVALTWLGHRLLSARRTGERQSGWGGAEAQRLLQVIGLSHIALLVLAIAIQIGQAIPIPFVVPALTAFALLIWFPGMVIAAVTQTTGRTDSQLLSDGRSAMASLLISAVACLLWLLVVGRYLFDQLGHLI